MGLFLFPDHVQVDIRFSIDGPTLALLQQLVDQQSDRTAAGALAKDVKASSDALAAVVSS